MRHIILLTMLICGLFVSNVYADTGVCSSQPSAASGPFTYSYSDGENVHINYNGCDFTGPSSSISDVTYKIAGGMFYNSGNPYKEPDKLTVWPNNEVVYTPAQCAARPPVLDKLFPNYWRLPNGNVYAYYDGCEYEAKGAPSLELHDGFYSNWYPTGRVKPSETGTGSGPVVTGGGTGPVISGGGTVGSSGSGSGTGGTSGSSSGSGSTPVTGGTGGTGGSSGSSSGSGGTGVSSGSSSGSGGGVLLDFNYTNDGWAIPDSSGSKPGETTWTFTTPLPAPVPYGEPTGAEIKNYAKDFFIYNRRCGSSCLSYFNTTGGMFTPVTCQDLAFNLNVPHKKPNCRSDDIAWYDNAGNFIEFKYPLTDKARHDFINKLKGDFGLGGGVVGGGDGSFNTRLSPSHNLDPVYTNRLFPQFYSNKTPYDIMSYNNMSLSNIDKGTFLNRFELGNVRDELERFHADSNDFNYKLLKTGDGVFSELQQFHHDSNDYNSKLLDRLNTDNLDSEARDSVSNLSASITGLLNGENVGGEFAEASKLMGQIGNGADSPLLGKFLDKNLIPMVDTHQCVMPVFGRGTEWEFTLSSDKWLKLKQILTFVMYAYTFLCLFDMLTNTGDRK
ncbi:hypothetical protein AH865_01785 [Salmonella enterica subsp. enterica serovar Infantis]|nr:hypothetical protein [Salmonella enterica subsp. enterica serovar Infantis]EGI5074292.1 hypothetical protein [Salmonella enterica subsp. enterica serovar Infantis]